MRFRFPGMVLMLNGLARAATIALAGTALHAGAAGAAEAGALGRYNAAIGDSSISGISSGAFMAVQFATAWSSVIRGVGVVAGGPYWCAKANAFDFLDAFTLPTLIATGPCMKGPPDDVAAFIAKADAKSAAGDIDPIQNLSRQKIYLFHGYNDSVVAKSVTDAAGEFYQHYLGDANRGNLYYQTALGAGHSLVVEREARPTGLNGCSDNASPYIDQCGYDQAGIILQHIYGALNAPNRGDLAGTLKSFDQSLYSAAGATALSLGGTGYVFVPKDCEDGLACRVHIALHGCKQDVGDIGQKFIENTGYNAWADTNRLIVLYPQTRASFPLPFNPFLPVNPEACWDWWGYVDHLDDYVTKSGPQILALTAMLDALTAGAAAPPEPGAAPGGAPGALAVTDTSDTMAALAWAPVAGATAYRVWRAPNAGAFALAGTVAGPSFGDSGLAPQTAYRWRVTAILGSGEGPPSAIRAATTRASPAPCDDPGSCPLGR
jgi:poly(3-hydroxybutyrate) depolymerase